MSRRFVQAILEWLDASGRIMQNRQILIIAVFSIFYFGAVSYEAARKLFWYDELFTLYMTSLPNLRTIATALRSGVDLNPPGFYVLTRMCQSIAGSSHLGTRLPAILGFWAMSIGLFLFLRRRVGVPFALAGMFLAVLTPAYEYATEARPYGIVMGCAGIALVCWQHAADQRRRRLALTGLSLALATALLSHCYAVLLCIPFALGEAIRTVRRRRIDWPMWLAFGISACPILLYPALFAANNRFVQHAALFSPTLRSIESTYSYDLRPIVWGMVPALILLVFMVSRVSPTREIEQETPGIGLPEVGALAGFSLIPFAAVLIAMKFSHVYFWRYSLPSIIGLLAFSILLLWLPASIRRTLGPATATLFALLAFAVLALGARSAAKTPLSASIADLTQNDALSAASKTNLPVVVTDQLGFLQLDHYGDPALLSKLYFVTNEQASIHHFGSNIFDAGYPLIKAWFPIRAHIEDFGSFIDRNKDFVLYDGGSFAEWNWLLPTLLQSHFDIQLLTSSGNHHVYRVTGHE